MESVHDYLSPNFKFTRQSTFNIPLRVAYFVNEQFFATAFFLAIGFLESLLEDLFKFAPYTIEVACGIVDPELYEPLNVSFAIFRSFPIMLGNQ